MEQACFRRSSVIGCIVYSDQIFLTIRVHPLPHNTLEGSCGILNQKPGSQLDAAKQPKVSKLLYLIINSKSESIFQANTITTKILVAEMLFGDDITLVDHSAEELHNSI